MNSVKAGFIGLGMIGGSIARAIREFMPESYVVAYDKDSASLSLAKQEGVVDVACSYINEEFKDLDFIFLCAPVKANETFIDTISPFISKDTILTDVGSVKGGIHKAVVDTPLKDNFIGGHPMSGSEKVGFANSKSHLFENAYYIMTPEVSVSWDKVEKYRDFITTIHALPIVLDSNHHDEIVGVISHLPHIIASGLVNFVKDKDDSNQLMRQLAAGGFRDITRIASSSPVMWEQICVTNSDWIADILSEYIESINQMREVIISHDSEKISEFFTSARDYRDSIPDRSTGPIEKSYVVYCDLVDEAGGIATISTILAANAINIKNIGIIHNREFEEGVLRIEFYDNESLSKGIKHLSRHHYTLYTR